MTVEGLVAIGKDDLQEAAKSLNTADIRQLVELLSEKDDKIRYPAFLLLQYRSQYNGDVYPYWDIFRFKLVSDNSYQRSIGIMLIAENVRWDSEGKAEDSIHDCLAMLQDEKPITIRQCIQSLGKIVSAKPELNSIVSDRLVSTKLLDIKETMRKSILLDILHVLAIIRKSYHTDEIESFIFDALSGEILDKKAKKQVEAIL